MEFDININDLELIFLPGRFPPKEYLDKYHKAYHCWRSVWEHAYQVELHNLEDMPSDSFTRQDEVLSLFYKGQCAGVTFFKWIDAAEEPVVEDSYFKRWPEIAFRKLCTQGKNIVISSYFTLHFDYRKNFMGLPWKDLLMGLIAKRFVVSGCDAMAGTTRLAKNVGEVAYRTGASPLIKNMPFASEEDKVDLVAWFQGKVGDSVVPGVAALVDQIYAERTVALVKPFHPITTVREVKRVA